jgi:hypothetical protein
MNEDADLPVLEEEQEEQETSGKAVAGFALGLGSILIPVLLSLPAALLGALGLGEIGRSRGRLAGKNLAVMGIIMGAITTIVGPLVIFFVIVPLFKGPAPVAQVKNEDTAIGQGEDAISRVRMAAARTTSQNNLKQLGLAFHSHFDVYRRLPPATVYGKDGRPLYSWRVLVLPFVEQQALYQQFNKNEAWDSPGNMPLLKQMPPVFAHPSYPEEAKQGLTRYQVFVGPAGEQPRPMFITQPINLMALNNLGMPNLFETQGATLPLFGVVDGLSNTIMLAEAAEPVPWTKAADIYYSSKQPLPKLCNCFRNGTNVLLGDGSVRFIDPSKISERTMRDAITADDGNPLGADWDGP